MSSALELDGQQQSHSLHATRLWPWPRPSSVRGTGTCTLSSALPSLFRSMDVSPSPQGPAGHTARSPLKTGHSVSARTARPVADSGKSKLCNRDAFQRSCTHRPMSGLRLFGSANIGPTQSNDARLRLSPCSAAETASTMIACVATRAESSSNAANWIDSKIVQDDTTLQATTERQADE